MLRSFLAEESPTPGRILAIRGRRVGRQEQMMEMLSSMDDQIAAPMFSHDGSWLSTADFSVNIRYIEIMQTL